MTRVVVHIDSMVLNGFGNADSRAIGDGMRDELARLLSDPVVSKRLASIGNMSSLDAGTISLAQGGRPQRLGMSAGRAIVRGLSQ
jgi:hypothetical protein